MKAYYSWNPKTREMEKCDPPNPVKPSVPYVPLHLRPEPKTNHRNIFLPEDLMPRRIELTRSTVRLEVGGVRW